MANVNVSVANQVVRTTNITDLNDNCQNLIFDYLDIRDISNLAVADVTTIYIVEEDKIKRYKESLRRAFAKKEPKKKEIEISINPIKAPRKIILLTTFGSEFKSLRMDYFANEETRRYERVLEDTLVNSCRTTLTRLRFDNCHRFSMRENQEPFPNVNSVTFHQGYVNSKLIQLHKWFPVMKFLKFENIYTSNPQCLHHQFPTLKMLTVWNPQRGRGTNSLNIFTNSNLKCFAKKNPQLEFLSIRQDDVDVSESGDNALVVNYDFMSSINNDCKSLNGLRLHLENDHGYEDEWPSVVVFENVTELMITLSELSCLGKIRLKSPTLQKLLLKGRKVINYESITNFIRDTSPVMLRVYIEANSFDMSNQDFLAIASTRSNLERVIIECLWIPTLPDAMITFLLHSETIKRVVGLINFVRDAEGNPSPSYGEMEHIFREKINGNGVVLTKWTYVFNNSIQNDLFDVQQVAFDKII